jgi:glycosyltransferase involved in cell wall biosynthesis|tara:strand:- start:346 stop:1437 length:1092 start_codon:yes stop_codon:yes gene_type:complete
MNKILAICTSPDKGGLELYFVKLVNHYNVKYRNITAVCRNNSSITELINSNVFNINKINFINIIYLANKIAKYINKEQINIIHVSWTKDLLFAVLIKLLCKPKIRIIYYRQMKLTRNKKDIYHKFIYNNIDVIIVITRNLLSECVRYLPVKKNKIIELPYGISQLETNKRITKEEIFKKLNLDLSIFTIGVFSRIEEQKGQHLVIEAINLLHESKIQLLIVGHSMDANYENHLKHLIDQYDLKNRIKFVPFVNKPMEIMGLLDLIILPTFEETFGLVVAEAMLMEIPVIGSNKGGVPEIIQDNKTGLLFESKNFHSLKDKISLMIKSKDLRVNLANNGKIFANREYDYQKHFSNLDKIMDNKL